MRGLRRKWRRLTVPIAKATALLLLLQLSVPSPCALLLPQNLLLALGGICHAATDDGNQPSQQPVDSTCCHCLACAAGAAMTLLPPDPGLPGARVVSAELTFLPAGDSHRATTLTAYASRAPPMIG